ncbi:glycosyltransferase [Pelagicoccus albus]|uniref:Glycosyltransferase n=1 Tax=Pelagicoccus albus TaxID=415222 RepID=A0A7X1E981_9BACT|nr:glycosyltransferase [Pelagicoccus albus]MBC2606933.1 glycosyltransferase [Pelagicoccus albus]
MPAYNAANFVESAIQSVFEQSYDNWELLVVDDGSEDATADIVSRFSTMKNVHLHRHEGGCNRGVSYSRALGISRANGDYVAFLDADDLFKKEKLAKQVRMFERYPEVSLCHTNIEIVSETKAYPKILDVHFDLGNAIRLYDHSKDTGFMISNHICNSSVMIRRSAIDGIALGMDQLFQVEDWILWVLLSEKGKFVYLPEIMTEYRYHAASATAKSQASSLERMYSKIELYMGVLSRSRNPRIQSLGVRELKKTLSKVYRSYAREGVEGDGDNAIEQAFRVD